MKCNNKTGIENPLEECDQHVNPKVRGTYIVKDLAYILLQWMIPSYCWIASKLLSDFVENKQMVLYQRQLEEKDAQIQQKDNAVDRIEKLWNEQKKLRIEDNKKWDLEKEERNRQFEELMAEHRASRVQMNEMQEDIVGLQDDVDLITNKLTNIADHCEEKAYSQLGIKRKTPEKERKYAIIKLNTTQAQASRVESINGCIYKKCGGTHEYIQKTLYRANKGFPGSSIIVEENHVTSIDLHCALKKHLNNALVQHKTRTSQFKLNGDINEADLIEAVRELSNKSANQLKEIIDNE